MMPSPFRSDALALSEQLRRIEEGNAAAAAEVRELARQVSLPRELRGGAPFAIRVAVCVFLAVAALGVGALLGSLAGGMSRAKRDTFVRAPSTLRRDIEVRQCWDSVHDLQPAYESCVGASSP
jgi:hypothetical protein